MLQLIGTITLLLSYDLHGLVQGTAIKSVSSPNDPPGGVLYSRSLQKSFVSVTSDRCFQKQRGTIYALVNHKARQ